MVEDGVDILLIYQYVEQFIMLFDLEWDINFCIDDYGEVFDYVLEILRGICIQFRIFELRIRDWLELMLCFFFVLKMLFDMIVMIWNDCFVILVK